ncbi:ubiquinone biosynthesis protein UbiB [Actinoplanes ianthinogenes]|uniref:Ubiquinone biosynthesis protein UbiB n=1 Tax=Actinoplanes ianthinogenes TaxID=122358 RepID=A0ABM7LKD4_9ACTN|nr:AarF/ABC1/UbiB kinase family protein [Actinoplanes ianthinogenes]BCJ39708.1 ubiquinone biosynthesis protein UbiB [Actinoplanes ianthinogenes]GGR47971.1 ubiquinone biosynthesis protein UbiB [Actinoplanes ianthinogenes]
MQVLLFIPFLALTVLLFAAVIRRLLGVPVGPGRTLVAAVLATLVLSPILAALAPPDPATVSTAEGTLLMLAAVCVSVLLAMAALVVLEVLLPSGTLPGPAEAWRAARRRVARTRRYSSIVRIALRHGLGRFLRGRPPAGPDSAAARRRLARSLRAALDEGGVTFVKVGQLLSTRRDLLPAEFIEELTALQDRAAPVPWTEISAVLDAELGDRAFAEIDPEPLAAASVAQVHAARLADGTAVVVKVRRPGIAAVVDRDLDILLRLAGTLEARTSWGRAFGARGLALGFAEALREELDFTVERDNLQTMAAALATTPERRVRVPTAYAELSTERVLVMGRLPGTPLGAAEPVLAGLDDERRQAVAAALLDSLLDQVLVHGVFHADLHPGNLLVEADGSLGMLDLGSVGRLDGVTRAAVGRLLAAVGRGDAVGASDALLDLADHGGDVDERDLQRALGVLLVRYAAPGSSAGVAAVTALLRTVADYGLGVPAAVAAVFRAFATVEGTLGLLRPGFDLLGAAREAGDRRLAEMFGPRNLPRTLEEELVTLLPMLRGLPRRIDRIGDAVENGRLRLNIRLFSDERDRRVVTGLIHQVLLTVIGATAGVMGILLLGTGGGPRISAGIGLFPLLGYGLLIISVVLVLRVLVVILRRD